MKKILYISTVSSKRLINDIYNKTGRNPGFAVQKFNRFIAQGINQNGVAIELYSKPPISRGRIWVNETKEIEETLQYHYVRYINLPVLKDLFAFCSSFYRVFKFGFRNCKEKAVICDVLAISMNMGAILASKLTGTKIVGIVTDMPGLMVNRNKTVFRPLLLSRFMTKINLSYIKYYSYYVFLTEQMSNELNTNKRPYIVMEALCDNSLNFSNSKSMKRNSPRTVLYAGGLHERYGLKILVDAFRMLKRNDIKLVLVGDGPFVDNLKEIVNEDARIEYKGVVPNEEVLRLELEATLLVNPRPTTEDFTKYSFPSKNMEYMASGTPLLTTKLPGIPTDYYPYIYLFDEESIEGYAKTLNKILDLSFEELYTKGLEAKKFVLEKKNYVVQSGRILELLNGC